MAVILSLSSFTFPQHCMAPVNRFRFPSLNWVKLWWNYFILAWGKKGSWTVLKTIISLSTWGPPHSWKSIQHVPEWDCMETVLLLHISYRESPCMIQAQLVRFPCLSLFPSPSCFFPEKEFKRVGYWDSFKLQSYLSTNTTPGWGSRKLILLWETSSLREMLGKKVKGRNTVRDLDQELEEQIED